jgi:hypothetical protein
MKNFFAVVGLFFCGQLVSYEESLKTFHALQAFVAAKEINTLESYSSMTGMFHDPFFTYKKLKRAIRTDMAKCRQAIRRMNSDDIEQYRLILDQLQEFYWYVKTHKECCKAIYFHNTLSQRYIFAFHNTNLVEHFEQSPELFGIKESCKYKHRAFFKKIAKDLKAIDKFEDTIHGDYGMLKAHNYVYKIELIKVRNYIYHTMQYQFETRYF